MSNSRLSNDQLNELRHVADPELAAVPTDDAYFDRVRTSGVVANPVSFSALAS